MSKQRRIYNNLCSLEEAREKCNRHKHKAATLLPVLWSTEAMDTGRPYSLRRWGVFESGCLIAVIKVRRDNRLEWIQPDYFSRGLVIEYPFTVEADTPPMEIFDIGLRLPGWTIRYNIVADSWSCFKGSRISWRKTMDELADAVIAKWRD